MTRSHDRVILAILLGVLAICGAAAAAASPEWTLGKKVSAIYPSYDGSAIVTSGNNLLYMANDSTVAWMDKPYDYVDVNGDGEYVVAAGPYATLFDRKGNKVWENENTGDSPSNDEPLKVKISRDGSLVLTYTSVKFHTWSVSGNLVGTNTSYLVTDGNAYFSDVAIAPSGDEIVFFTAAGIFAVNRSGAPISRNTDDWKCRLGLLADDGRKSLCAYDNRLYYGHTSGVLLWNKKIAGDTITSIAVSSATDPLVVAGSLDGYVYAVDSDGNNLWNNKLFPYRVDQPVTVTVTNDGSYISARSLDTKTMKGAVFLFNRKGNLLFSTEGEDAVGSLNPDGSSLLIGTDDDLSSYALATLAGGPPGEATVAETTAAPAVTTVAAATAVAETATQASGTAATTAVPATTKAAPGAVIVPVIASVLAIIAISSRR